MPQARTDSNAPREIVCFACEDYWYHPIRSRRHLMEGLARRGWRVLFVNSIGMQAPKLGQSDFWMRVTRKLRSIARWLRRPQPDAMPSFWVASPIALPFHGKPWARSINARLLRWQLRAMMRRAGLRAPIAWFGLPTVANLRGHLNEPLAILHNSDRYEAWGGLEGTTVRDGIDALVASTDLIISASKPLTEHFASRHRRSIHLPHGVDAEHFSRARLDPALEQLAALRDIPAPRIGYLGAGHQTLEPGLVRVVAERRPNVHQVFIGEAFEPIEHIRAQFPDRVHILPRIPYADVPNALRALDVAMMPLADTPWNMHANHLKMREYLLAGRPSLTTPHPEAEALLPNPLLIQAGPDAVGWLAGVDRAVAMSRDVLDPTTRAMRLDSAIAREAEPALSALAQGTWASRVEELERLLLEALDAKR